MSNKYNYSTEIIDHMAHCSDLVGFKASENFNQDVFCECGDLSINSPIEQLFYVSFKALLSVHSVPLHDAPLVNGQAIPFGMLISPQFTIAPYRVDFYISWHGYMVGARPSEVRSVVVECDSQQWHERTEKERRYEKKRDRAIARLGLHTFRFTGKEIKENPFAPAIEVCSFLLQEDPNDLREDILDVKSSLKR